MKLTRYMYQQFLKEIEMGSKNALIKKRIITYYIMVVRQFLIFQKNWI